MGSEMCIRDRFIDRVNAYDDLGTTALESLERAINAFNDKKLSTLWEKL